MGERQLSPGYLAEVEASHLDCHAIPGAVMLQLRRAVASETAAGRKPRRMFIELSPSEAVQFWGILGRVIGRAGALAQQPSHLEVVNL